MFTITKLIGAKIYILLTHSVLVWFICSCIAHKIKFTLKFTYIQLFRKEFFLPLSGSTNKAALDPKLVFPFARKLFRMKVASQEAEDSSHVIVMKVYSFHFVLIFIKYLFHCCFCSQNTRSVFAAYLE